jgi:hypothetical protein
MRVGLGGERGEQQPDLLGGSPRQPEPCGNARERFP